MGRVRRDHIRGSPQASAVRLYRTAEVTPSQLVIRAAGHHGQRIRLRTVVEGASGYFIAGPIPGIGRGGTKDRGHLSVSEKGGTTLLEPTKTAPENWRASCVITGHLLAALRGQMEFRTADHLACIKEGRKVVWWRSAQKARESLAVTFTWYPVQGAR